MKIFKYEILIQSSFVLDLPINAKILSLQVQNGKAFIWCIIDENIGLFPRYFSMFGTGEDISEYDIEILKYIGTIQINSFVWHLFEDLT